jgi:dTDP-4-amino-4,6-dideoxygalactose transaminase
VAGIREICQKQGLLLIEDSACALGTRVNGQHVGHYADASCFSFHPRKAITTGEGGAVISHNPQLMERISRLRNHGIQTGVAEMPGGIDFVEAGLNYRLTDFQAALALGPLERFPEELNRRSALAKVYLQELSSIDGLRMPQIPEGHALQSFMLVLPPQVNRNALIQQLRAEGIQTNLGAQALHCLSYYRKQYALQPSDFPVAAELYYHGLVLPLYGQLSESDVKHITACLQRHLPA